MPDLHPGWYGIAVATLLIAKLALSVGRGRRTQLFRDPPTLRLAAIITAYNETPAMLTACLESLLAQTRRPDAVMVIDDCSDSDDTQQVICRLTPVFDAAGVRLDFVRHPVRRGKRHALAAGFTTHAGADTYLCVDSDTVLDPDAVAHALQPLSRRRVHAVTGLVMAHNRRTNLLTRLIDLRYVNAFLGERVAYSRLGSVLCVCGSLAVYRGWVVRKHLDDFLGQRFLGREATFGDDRRLTFYALLEGQAVIQPAAVGWTDVPERMGHYLRQQARWTRSFIREGALLAARWRMAGRVCWWLNLIELATWLAFTSALIVAVAVAASTPHTLPVLAAYPLYVCAAAWLRSVHYLRAAGRVPLGERLVTFAAAPLYALMNLLLLIPLRLWALATLRRTDWGTRQTVEIPRPRSLPAQPVPADGPPTLELVPSSEAPTVEIPLKELHGR